MFYAVCTGACYFILPLTSQRLPPMLNHFSCLMIGISRVDQLRFANRSTRTIRQPRDRQLLLQDFSCTFESN